VLIKATLFTLTNDEDKDHDTGVCIDVKTSDALTLTIIAHANIEITLVMMKPNVKIFETISLILILMQQVLKNRQQKHLMLK
jgi:hypothetical protein